MKNSDYQKQLAEILLKREEDASLRREVRKARLSRPSWIVGILLAYLSSLSHLLGSRLVAAIFFMLHLTCLAIYLEIWNVPKGSIQDALAGLDSTEKVVRGLVLFLSLPISGLINIFLISQFMRFS